MPVKFRDPQVQALAEKLLEEKEREYLVVNGKTVYSATMPTDEKYAEHLRQQIPKLRQMAERIETLLLLYDFAKMAGLSCEVTED